MALSGVMTVYRLCNNISLLGLLLLAVTSCKTAPVTTEDKLPFYNTAAFDAEWINESDAKYQQIHTIDSFSMRDQSGNVFTDDSLKGKIYVVNFFFTSCPSICPKMMNNLGVLQDSFKNDDRLRLVSFSVTPRKDSVPRLKEYAGSHNINNHKWHLLTGSKERIYTLGRQSYFAEKTPGLQKDSSEFLHTETMLLIDGKARIRGIYNATQKPDVERITEDIRILEKEKI